MDLFPFKFDKEDIFFKVFIGFVSWLLKLNKIFQKNDPKTFSEKYQIIFQYSYYRSVIESDSPGL